MLWTGSTPKRYLIGKLKVRKTSKYQWFCLPTKYIIWLDPLWIGVAEVYWETKEKSTTQRQIFSRRQILIIITIITNIITIIIITIISADAVMKSSPWTRCLPFTVWSPGKRKRQDGSLSKPPSTFSTPPRLHYTALYLGVSEYLSLHYQPTLFQLH